MKPLLTLTLLSALSLPLAAAPLPSDWTAGFQEGKPSLKSVGQLAFGPEGILFLADSKGAAVVAFSTGDTQAAAAAPAPLKIEGINQKIAALLGTSAEESTLR